MSHGPDTMWLGIKHIGPDTFVFNTLNISIYIFIIIIDIYLIYHDI